LGLTRNSRAKTHENCGFS